MEEIYEILYDSIDFIREEYEAICDQDAEDREIFLLSKKETFETAMKAFIEYSYKKIEEGIKYGDLIEFETDEEGILYKPLNEKGKELLKQLKKELCEELTIIQETDNGPIKPYGIEEGLSFEKNISYITDVVKSINYDKPEDCLEKKFLDNVLSSESQIKTIVLEKSAEIFLELLNENKLYELKERLELMCEEYEYIYEEEYDPEEEYKQGVAGEISVYKDVYGPELYEEDKFWE